MKKTATDSAPTAQQEEHRVLLVEDDVGLQKQMRWALSPYVVDVAGNRLEALEKISAAKPCFMLLLIKTSIIWFSFISLSPSRFNLKSFLLRSITTWLPLKSNRFFISFATVFIALSSVCRSTLLTRSNEGMV